MQKKITLITPINGPDPLIKIGDVLRRIAPYFTVESMPSRRTVTGWIDSGKIEGKQIDEVYFAYESSLNKFLALLSDKAVLAA